MNRESASPHAGEITPWTLRVFDAMPGNPLQLGVAFLLLLLLLFFAGRIALDGGAASSSNDLRVAMVHLLLVTYCSAAYAYLLMSARQTTRDLAPVAIQPAHWQSHVDRVGRYPWWLLPVIGLASYLVFGVATTNITTPDPIDPWDWRGWSYDVAWHRVSSLLFVWWLGCLCYVLVVESARLSRLSGELRAPDLLELKPYQPLIRQGLTNVLLAIGVISIMSLFLFEARYGPTLLVFWIGFIGLAWVGMLLPLRGTRRRIRAAKAAELEWCDDRLRAARDALRDGAEGRPGVSEIVAYRETIERVRNWPFDNSTVIRFVLLTLIRVGSWGGGAIVVRGLDLFLS